MLLPRWGRALELTRATVCAVATAALIVAGCAPTLKASNERGGVIKEYSLSRATTFALAEKHCQQFGRHAVITDTDPLESVVSFECKP